MERFVRFAGIDIGSESHWVAVVSGDGEVLAKAQEFAEDTGGYSKVREILGSPEGVLVILEATGHYWQNLFAHLVADGYGLVLLNPLRSRRFADEEMLRTKTDAVDAVSLARFAAQKRPDLKRLEEAATLELRELVRLRDRLQQDLGDRVRQLHRAVDLGFPEFTRFVRDLSSYKATAILRLCPTAASYAEVGPGAIANLRYDGRHTVGRELAHQLVEAAAKSVGSHHGEPYRLQIAYFCEDIDTLRRRLAHLDEGLRKTLERHEVGKLLTTIDGLGTNTVARIVAELGDPSEFDSPDALASYVGVVPQLRHSGKHRPLRAGCGGSGNARLRAKLWMPVLTAVRKNAWLRYHYERLRAAGKLAKVALIACARKLLHAIYSVAKNRKPFVPNLNAPALAAATA